MIIELNKGWKYHHMTHDEIVNILSAHLKVKGVQAMVKCKDSENQPLPFEMLLLCSPMVVLCSPIDGSDYCAKKGAPNKA